jgi:ABC-2 type transport system ATP-binding protein
MIKIENLSFQFKKQDYLFTDLNFEQQSSNIIGLLGCNGSGKTTFLKLLCGLIQPKSGTIFINGFKPFDRNPNFLSDCYLVPEEFAFSSITIKTYIKATSNLYPKFDYKKMDTILTEFKLEANKNLNELSHGQRKKFLIAFGLATNCSLLIFDEPTNGLDIPSKSLFRKIVVSSISEEQLVFISTHQVKDIDTIIDQIVVLNEGTMLFNESVDTITQQWAFKTTTSSSEAENALYSEKSIGGYRVLYPADESEETVIDIELLFNAIISKSLLNKPSYVNQ